MDLSIIIPTKDRHSILDKSLSLAFKAIQSLNAEIIVVNDSKTNSVDIPSAYTGKVRMINNPKSGVASARNLGAKKAQADLLLFLDDDMWISEDNLLTTLSLHHNQTDCCIILNWVYPVALDQEIKATQFGRYLHHFGFASLKGWCNGMNWSDEKLFPVNGITSQYLSIRKRDFWKAGGYNENFPHAGFEDHDFGVRLLQHGVQPYVYPLSTVYHNEADRMNVEAWLARKKRGGETRKVAVQVGYSNTGLTYGFTKKKAYRLLSVGKPVLLKLLQAIPNQPGFDPLYFKVLNLLLGTASFEGYYRSNRCEV
jgi:GT2 family glycosyltransferase